MPTDPTPHPELPARYVEVTLECPICGEPYQTTIPMFCEGVDQEDARGPFFFPLCPECRFDQIEETLPG